jgi:hypothetical protein
MLLNRIDSSGIFLNDSERLTWQIMMNNTMIKREQGIPLGNNRRKCTYAGKGYTFFFLHVSVELASGRTNLQNGFADRRKKTVNVVAGPISL